MKSVKNKKILLLLLILEIFTISPEVLALEVAWPSSPAGTRLTDSSTLPEVIRYFYEWGIALGGLAAFISLVIGGFQYLTSMGEPARIREAKDRIYSAFLGLILLLGSWLILNTINPQLTTLKMPSLPMPSETLQAVTTTKPEITKPCDKVDVYDQPNFQGSVVVTINRGSSATNLNIRKGSDYSIRFVYVENGEEKTGGACTAELYYKPDCSGDPVPIYSSVTNISTQLYLKQDIKCIKVK
jgi:hypothetical protein